MRHEDLREALRKMPFLPFKLHLPEGRAVSVAHHDFALLAPNGRLLTVYEIQNGRQKMNLLDVMLISSLEFDDMPVDPELAAAQTFKS
jgi:hypothetical protein